VRGNKELLLGPAGLRLATWKSEKMLSVTVHSFKEVWCNDVIFITVTHISAFCNTVQMFKVQTSPQDKIS
jgi:hypothetical protein